MTTEATRPEFVDPAELKPAQLKADIVRAREELAATLDAIEYKLNLPKQLKRGGARLRRKIATVREESPEALVAGVVGVVAALGAVAYLVVDALHPED
jgi:hypothetical protein